MLERFAIFAPTMGIHEDGPSILLPEAMLPTAENVRIEDGEIHRVLARDEVLDDCPALASGSAYYRAVMALSPVAYWRLGEASGTTATDETGNHNGTYTDTAATLNLAATGATTSIDTDTGITIDYDEGTGDGTRIVVGSLGTLGSSLGSGLSVECWIKPTFNAPARTQNIILDGYENRAGPATWVHLEVLDASEVSQLSFEVGDSAGKYFTLTSADAALAAAWADGQWHHLVVTWNGNATGTAYLDGAALAINGVVTGGGAWAFANWTVDLALGGTGDVNATPLYRGGLDEVAIYNSVLSAAQAAANYAANAGSGSASILHYHWLSKSTGSNYLFCFTADNAYLWSTTSSAWTHWTHDSIDLTSATAWSTATFADQVIATNGIDKVMIGDDATAFDEMGAAGGIAIPGGLFLTAAQFVATHENYVLLGNTTEGGTNYPRRLRWCAIGDITDWAAAGGAVDIGGSDKATGAIAWGGNLLILKERSIHRMYLTGGDLVWQVEELTSAYGCDAPGSAIAGRDGVPIFFATDRTFRTATGEVLSDQIDDTLKQIPDAQVGKIRAWRVDEYGEIWWACPVGADATANNKVLVLAEGGRWTIRDMPVTCFGRYRQSATTTIDDLIAPLTIDTWDWPSIDWLGGTSGSYTDIGATGAETFDVHGDTQDDGDDFTGTFDLATDLGRKGRPYQYKRLLNLRVYARNEQAGELTVEAQADENQWSAVGTADLDGGAAADLVIADLPCDVRARHFRVRVSGTTHFRFLGMVFEYVKDGFQ